MGHGNRTPSAALVAVLSASLLAPGAACPLDSLLSPPRGVHPTGPDSLVQLRRDSSTLIRTGGSVPEPSIVMRAALRDSGLTDPVRLELEIQPVGTDFQGQATAASDPTSSGAHAYVSVGGLKNNTGYHWQARVVDRKSTRLNSSHSQISYAVFCLKKKKKKQKENTHEEVCTRKKHK